MKLLKYKKIKFFLLSTIGILILPFLLLFAITEYNIYKYPAEINPSEEFCIEGYFLFPKFYRIDSSLPAEIEINKDVKIFEKYRILAREICLLPTEILGESNTYTISFTYLSNPPLDIFQKQIEVTTHEYPKIEEIQIEENVNIDQVLEYELTYESSLLEYYIFSDEKSVQCEKESLLLKCSIGELNLNYEDTYELQLVSIYEGKVVKILDTRIVNTLSSLKIESSNIPSNGIFQSTSIQELQLSLNKEIESSFRTEITDESGNEISHTSSLNTNILSISPSQQFLQNTKYLLRIYEIKALDGSRPEGGEFLTEFSIDDGPSIKSTNLKTGFSSTSDIILTFNQDIKSAQDIKKYIKLNSSTDYNFSIKGKQVTIKPNTNLITCTNQRVDISKGIISTTGLISSKGSSYTFKTKCERVARIGTSVQGRGIFASYFGNGSKKILLFGAMHGSEANTRTTMSKLIAELEVNSSRIPEDKTVIVVTTFNPDGIANRSRFNANGVDLNRNFNSSNWTQGTYFKENFYPTGGGQYPFSEPESIAIRDLVIRENPYVSISFHSAAAYVVPSNTSRSVELGILYAQLSGYKYIAPGTQGAFTYDITGTFEGWAGQNGYNAMVIELASAYNDEFSRNRNAIWKMIEQQTNY